MGFDARNPDLRREEFGRLFQWHQRELYGYIFSLLPDASGADEVSQETYLLLWKEFGRFDPSTDFGAWARTVAYYQVLAHRKKASRERLCFDSELLEVLADRAAVRWNELAARQTQLIDCLAELSQFKREVIRLYYRFGMTAKTVAERLGRSVATVEKTLLRTRRSLRECIETAIRREEHL
jgi:RNA polymerase sigma-70 factor, ECF subfamily